MRLLLIFLMMASVALADWEMLFMEEGDGEGPSMEELRARVYKIARQQFDNELIWSHADLIRPLWLEYCGKDWSIINEFRASF